MRTRASISVRQKLPQGMCVHAHALTTNMPCNGLRELRCTGTAQSAQQGSSGSGGCAQLGATLPIVKHGCASRALSRYQLLARAWRPVGDNVHTAGRGRAPHADVCVQHLGGSGSAMGQLAAKAGSVPEPHQVHFASGEVAVTLGHASICERLEARNVLAAARLHLLARATAVPRTAVTAPRLRSSPVDAAAWQGACLSESHAEAWHACGSCTA